MLPITIAPSLPAASFAEITSLCAALEGVTSEIQIDLVDGHYVPYVSWPFTEHNPLTALQQLRTVAADFSLEVDCMLLQPETYLDAFVEAGAKRVVIHMGSTTAYDMIIAHAHYHGYALGFALINDEPLSTLYPYIDDIDYVQLMGIAHVGQQGQPFDVRTLARVRALRDQFPDVEIAVDGSVNETTITQLYAAGVTRFAPGSAISKAPDPAAAYKQLRALLQ